MKGKVLIVEDEFIEASDLRSILERAGYRVIGVARTVASALEYIGREQPSLVLLDIFLNGKLTGIDLAHQLKEKGIAFVFLSADSNEKVLTAAKATEPYGFLVKPFRENDLLVTLEIARYRHEHSSESKYRKEALLQTELERIANDTGTWEEKLLTIGRAMQSYIPFDLLVTTFDPVEQNGYNGVSFLRIGFDEYQSISVSALSTITGLNKKRLDELHQMDQFDSIPTISMDREFERLSVDHSLKSTFIDAFKMESLFCLPLHLPNRQQCEFCFFSRRPDAYTNEHLALAGRITSVLTKCLDVVLPHSPKPMAESPGKKNKSAAGFEGIIGKSHLLLNVFDNIVQVAPTNTSILILGESGTGKEMIAGAIHQLSQRRDEKLVKVNCAAIPPTLIESELFGHEKGSFTGATDKRIGKFEQAHKGTIFLDEIGELPLELQVKLLHVLQDREIERIGARSVTKIDVRVIAATNRNLEKEVAEGRFRLDLYYRLNVIPITLPPLRERKEDIPDLIDFFIDHYSCKEGRKISGLSDKALKALMAHHWPGNIRELQHLIERCVLLTRGTIIDEVPIPTGIKKEGDSEGSAVKTIRENERDHIVHVLQKCKGRIWGTGGAAEILNLPPTTLRSKMKKLGIEKVYKD